MGQILGASHFIHHAGASFLKNEFQDPAMCTNILTFVDEVDPLKETEVHSFSP
jgi:hypothetical protein